MTKNEKQQNKSGSRLLALDVLRGITIAGMILVNNPGSWGAIYAPLRHAEWNGLTPTDLVFPFFMFIMGVSTFFSLRKYNFELTLTSGLKILRRTVLIFAIGIALAWFGLTLRGITSERSLWDAVFNFDRLRLLGVLPRLALCYGIGSLIALLVPRKGIAWAIGGLLVLYSILLLLGNGYTFAENNIIYIVDNAIVGPAHLYTDVVGGVRLHLDPEGLLGTLPSVAHVLIGFLCGGIIIDNKDNLQRISKLFIIGTILTFAGFLLSYGLPINKKIWSPTYVLTTCGLAASFLALLIWIIDIKGYRRWCRFFEVFGLNPLFLFCLAGVLANLFAFIRLPYAGSSTGVASLKTIIYEGWLTPMCCGDATLASLFFAILFIIINWGIGYVLYRKNIIIKI